MKRFEFPLERVREWRLSELDMEMAAAAALALELSRITAERQAIEREREAAERSILAASSVSAAELAALDAFRLHAENAAAEADRRRQDCEQRIVRQRRRILEARQRCELLSRLRQRSLAAWRSGLQREEEALAGELFLARFNRERNP